MPSPGGSGSRHSRGRGVSVLEGASAAVAIRPLTGRHRHHCHEAGRLVCAAIAAARSGVAVSTLHFYEAKGLISSWRNSGNQRRYGREVLRRVAVIKVAQRTGIPLGEIREAMQALAPDKELASYQSHIGQVLHTIDSSSAFLSSLGAIDGHTDVDMFI